MDRQIVFPGAIPLETDILSTNKNAMVAISKLAAAILGTGTLVNGLACTPTSPATLTVNIAPGEIYSLANIDGTTYGSLAADTTHSILKQGISLDTVNLSCPAPLTSGYSINYLIQATYSDTDAVPVTLPYYNASNPAMAYSGPSNSGTPQNTVRKGVCTVSAKAGVAATTGTQTTPSADAGYTGIFVVTVAYGATTITAGNISTVSGAPFITNTLTQLAPIASPTFTGTPAAPNPTTGTRSTQLATMQMFANEFAASINGNGYQIFPSGLILQWGASTITSIPETVNFNTTFPSACFGVITTDISTAGSVYNQGVDSHTTSNFLLRTNAAGSDTFFWAAIGK